MSLVRTTFIYALNCPVTGQIRYIGKSNNPKHRLLCHLNALEVCHRTNWIRSLQTKGLTPILEILDEVPENEWVFWEMEYIRLYRALGFRLVNGTEGGDGLFNPSKETREKIGAANRGRKIGKVFSPQALENYRVASLNKKSPRNTSGFVGVTRHQSTKRWRAFITVFTRQITVGSFLKIEDAVFARALAMDRHFSV